MKDIIQELADKALEDFKKLLLKQHLFYIATGPCNKKIDIMFNSIIKKDK